MFVWPSLRTLAYHVSHCCAIPLTPEGSVDPMKRSAILCIVAAGLLAAGCGKTEEQRRLEDMARKAEEAGKAIQEGTQGMAEALQGLRGADAEGRTVEPVDFRELKALLPASLPGMERENAEGEKNSALGVKVSQANARYASGSAGTSATVSITDMGSVSGLVGLATYAWAGMDVDRETETGYERTTTFDGHKAFEKYDNTSRSGEISIMVAGRFVVQVEGNDVPMDFLKDAARSIDLNKLAAMKDAGVAH